MLNLFGLRLSAGFRLWWTVALSTFTGCGGGLSFRIETVPPGATVSIDNGVMVLGPTPLDLDLKERYIGNGKLIEYGLTVTLEGYDAFLALVEGKRITPDHRNLGTYESRYDADGRRHLLIKLVPLGAATAQPMAASPATGQGVLSDSQYDALHTRLTTELQSSVGLSPDRARARIRQAVDYVDGKIGGAQGSGAHYTRVESMLSYMDFVLSASDDAEFMNALRSLADTTVATGPRVTGGGERAAPPAHRGDEGATRMIRPSLTFLPEMDAWAPLVTQQFVEWQYRTTAVVEKGQRTIRFWFRVRRDNAALGENPQRTWGSGLLVRITWDGESGISDLNAVQRSQDWARQNPQSVPKDEFTPIPSGSLGSSRWSETNPVTVLPGWHLDPHPEVKVMPPR